MTKVVAIQHKAVCWSQVPFVNPEPSETSLRSAGLAARPSPATVWKHLMLLSKLRPKEHHSTQRLVEDIQATYQYLLTHLDASMASFDPHRNAKVWLNVDKNNAVNVTQRDLGNEWTSLENMILDSPVDAPPLYVARVFLAPYSTLLKQLGCQSIHYPTIARPQASSTSALIDKLRAFRHQKRFTDVTFEVDSGEKLHAHQNVLGANSAYINGQFSGAWAQQSGKDVKMAFVRLEEMTVEALTTLLDFCYDEHQPWLEKQRVSSDNGVDIVANKLDSLLDLLEAANRWQMAELHSLIETELLNGVKYFIRPDNVHVVKGLAEEAQAKALHEYCFEFLARNAQAVLLVEASQAGENEA